MNFPAFKNHTTLFLTFLFLFCLHTSFGQTKTDKNGDEDITHLFKEMTYAPALEDFQLSEEQQTEVSNLVKQLHDGQIEDANKNWLVFLESHKTEKTDSNHSLSDLAASILRESSHEDIKKMLTYFKDQNIQFTEDEMKTFDLQGLSQESRQSYLLAANILKNMQDQANSIIKKLK